jgi:hypothetical protein
MIASSKFAERFRIHVTCVMLFARIVALPLQVIYTYVDRLKFSTRVVGMNNIQIDVLCTQPCLSKVRFVDTMAIHQMFRPFVSFFQKN